MTQIRSALERQFERSRIVFWLDEKQQWRDQFDGLELPDVNKIHLQNQEFGFKRQALRLEPNQKFLVYRDAKIADEDNWLLDMQLSFATFQADPISLWMLEVGLNPELREVVDSHKDFFKDSHLREALKDKLDPNETATAVRQKMIACCLRVFDPGLDPCCEALFKELASEENVLHERIKKAGMAADFWRWVEARYGYHAAEPTPLDMCLKLFREANSIGLGNDPTLKPDAMVFLRRFRDGRQTMDDFCVLSARMAELLGIETLLHGKQWKSLLGHDWFRLVDQKILTDLVRGLLNGDLAPKTCQDVARKRTGSLWFKELEDGYRALEVAEALFTDVACWKAVDENAQAVYQRYERDDFRIDQSYRKFLAYYRNAKQPTYLQALQERVEARYVNGFLIPHAEHWQQRVDGMETWGEDGFRSQRKFFASWVAPYLDQSRRKKICVVISDALRYEVADDLRRRLHSENMYEAKLESCLGVLPSYTQLGMASLLPPGPLEVLDDGSGLVRHGSSSTSGLDNRGKILAELSGVRSAALKHDDVLKFRKEELRELIRDNDLLYVFHNKIDAVGDKRDTEEQLAEAADIAIEELVQVVKKLGANNANNVLVTADHGFQYQYSALEESDFSSAKPDGRLVVSQTRRYVVGKGLQENTAFRKWTAAQLGLQGDLEFLIPKATLRLRLSGAGSRFVHGGATLQEVVVPVLSVNKKRQGDIKKLEIELLTSSNLITSNLCNFTLYQRDAVSEKRQPRTLRATLYDQDEVIALSDSKVVRFDSTSEHARDREVRVSLLLGSKADAYNGKDIVLKLEEAIDDSDQYTTYHQVLLTLRKSFTTDFDF